MFRTIVLLLAFISAAAAANTGGQPLVDSRWLSDHLTDDNLVILDVRSAIDSGGDRNTFQEGHIPGSIYSSYTNDGWRESREGVKGLLPPVDSLERLIGSLGISNSDTVVIVPAGTGPTDFGSAARVYWTFRVLGHDKVAILNGGLAGWQAAGYEVASGNGDNRPMVSFEGTLQEDLIATVEEVIEARDSQVQLVDARPSDYFRGETKSPAARSPGTIPAAVNLQHQTLLSQEDKAWYLDVDNLAGKINKSELSSNARTIAFCNTGHWAATDWFVLSEVAGFEQVALYDGSMAEWSQDSNRPMQVAKQGIARLLDFFN